MSDSAKKYYYKLSLGGNSVIPSDPFDDVYFYGSVIQTPREHFVDQCKLSHTLITSNATFLALWNKGTFCKSYFCDNSSTIYYYFQSKWSSEIGLHISLLNHCMLCRAGTSQKFPMFVKEGSCIGFSRRDNASVSNCLGSHCGDRPSDSLCFYTEFSGAPTKKTFDGNPMCFEWSSGKIMYKYDIVHRFFFRFYLFYGVYVLLGLRAIHFILVVIFLTIPMIHLTYENIIRFSSTRMANMTKLTRSWEYIRLIFSLYNQSVLLVTLEPLFSLVYHSIEIFAVNETYPILLFVIVLTLGIFLTQNILVIILHAADTHRISRNLPLHPIYSILLALNSALTAISSIVYIVIMMFPGTFNVQSGMLLLFITCAILFLISFVLMILVFVAMFTFMRNSASSKDRTFVQRVGICWRIQYIKPLMVIQSFSLIYFTGFITWVAVGAIAGTKVPNFARSLGDFFAGWTFFGIFYAAIYLTLLYVTLFSIKDFLRAYRSLCCCCRQKRHGFEQPYLDDDFKRTQSDLSQSLLENESIQEIHQNE